MRRYARGTGVLLLLASICCVQIGCYKRVIREDRYSSESSEVWEPNVSRERAVGGCDQDEVLAAGQAHDDLLYALVELAGLAIDFTDERLLLLVSDTDSRIDGRIKIR